LSSSGLFGGSFKIENGFFQTKFCGLVSDTNRSTTSGAVVWAFASGLIFVVLTLKASA
jgi:hypothetical protein